MEVLRDRFCALNDLELTEMQLRPNGPELSCGDGKLVPCRLLRGRTPQFASVFAYYRAAKSSTAPSVSLSDLLGRLHAFETVRDAKVMILAQRAP